MCGIVAVVGRTGAAALVLDGLRRLEYRGYDSSGYCYAHAGRLTVHKTVGGVDQLTLVADGTETLALGHTRWATHGGVTQANAHPHADCTGRLAVVHNGILENHRELRAELEAAGHAFRSETDSEVIAHLLEEQAAAPLLDALRATLARLRGAYSIAAVRVGDEAVAFAKNSTPLILGFRAGANTLASDPHALTVLADEVAYVEDGEHGIVRPDAVELYDARGAPRTLRRVPVAWETEESEKAGFAHYMLKEIHETPQVLNRLLSGRVTFGPPYVRLDLDPDLLRHARRVKLIGAGTSYHACLVGAHYLRTLAGIPAQAELAPEYKDREPHEEDGTLLIAVSQSGETLDTLEALKRVEPLGHPVLALTNNPHSAIARRADAVLPLSAGPEIGVAATKTFLAQTLALLLLALQFARHRGRVGDAELAWHAHRLKELPRFFARFLSDTAPLAAAGRYLSKYAHAFVLGKGVNLHAAQEGALKLKEIAYQHAEAYSAGELKHGPFALLTNQTPTLVLLPEGPGSDKILNTVMEVRARGSPLVLVTCGNVDASGLAEHWVQLPACPEPLQPILYASALHLLAYETALQRGCEIDRPRNLAKSVTVE